MADLTNLTSNSMDGRMYHLTAGHNTNATIDGIVWMGRVVVRNASAGAVTFTMRQHSNTSIEFVRLRVGAVSWSSHNFDPPIKTKLGVRIFRRGYGGNHGINSTITCQLYSI